MLKPPAASELDLPRRCLPTDSKIDHPNLHRPPFPIPSLLSGSRHFTRRWQSQGWLTATCGKSTRFVKAQEMQHYSHIQITVRLISVVSSIISSKPKLYPSHPPFPHSLQTLPNSTSPNLLNSTLASPHSSFNFLSFPNSPSPPCSSTTT